LARMRRTRRGYGLATEGGGSDVDVQHVEEGRADMAAPAGAGRVSGAITKKWESPIWEVDGDADWWVGPLEWAPVTGLNNFKIFQNWFKLDLI
jgi:hypothetical protein